MEKMKKVVISKQDLINNLKIIDSLKQEECKIIGVVKANGMGLDLIQYSKFLVENGIEMLAVSEPEEALDLRNNKINSEVLLLTPINEEDVLEKLVQNEITITLSTLGQAKILIKISEKLEKKINVHIKIDTGFSRYGFLYNEIEKIFEIFKMKEFLNINGMYTHFSNAVNANDTKLQFERFEKIVNALKSQGNDTGILHCCNSTAFIKYPSMHLDAVRLGSIIQGRTLIKVGGLKRIGKFITSISEIKDLPKGYNIGYGNTYKTKKKTKVAVISVGHNDGFEITNKRDNFNFVENIKSVGIEVRKIFKKEIAQVIIRNKKCNVLGRIGLNYSVVDISDIDGVELTDEVFVSENLLKINNQIRREYI